MSALLYIQRSRLDETPAGEGDIPHYALWEDGSEYEVWGQGEHITRRWHGPQFGTTEWVTEVEYRAGAML